MRLAIIRFSGPYISPDYYNVQEIGLARHLAKYGISTDLFFVQKPNNQQQIIYPDPANKSIRLFYLPAYLRLPSNHCLIRGLKDSISHNRYDIVQIQDSYSVGSVQAGVMLRDIRCPVVLHQGIYHNPIRVKRQVQFLFEKSAGRLLRKTVAACIAKTRDAKEYLEYYGYKNIVVLPMGLDADRFKDVAIPSQPGHLFEGNKTGLSLLYVGTIRPHRKIDFLVRVCKELGSRGLATDFVLVGEGSSMPEYVNLVKKLGVERNVHFVGRVPNDQLSPFYSNANFFLLASESEILGMVYMESLLHGLPVITNSNAGSRSVISCGSDGFILDTLSVKEWCDRIQSVWNDRGTYERMRMNARENSRRFHWSAVAKQYADFYRDVIENHGTPK